MKQKMVAIGNFFFKWRNYLFPVFVIALFAFRAPAPALFGISGLEYTKNFLAILLTLAGLGVRAVVIGFAYIKRGGLNKKVYADTLVTEGMFELCRNPLYVGNMLVVIGLFVMHGDPLVMVIGIGFYAFIYQCIIYAEEAFLAKKFGKDFKTYCKRVPRWVPVLSRFHSATDGMRFYWKRVLAKDYSTVTTGIISIALVKFYEYGFALPLVPDQKRLIALIVLSLIFVTAVNVAKKTGNLKVK